jgi:hypothetical protein
MQLLARQEAALLFFYKESESSRQKVIRIQVKVR